MSRSKPAMPIAAVLLTLLAACADHEPKAEEPVAYERGALYGDAAEADDAGAVYAPASPPPAAAPHWSAEPPSLPLPPPTGERYRSVPEQELTDARSAPLSTFAADVDTAGYSIVRRFLDDGRLPPRAAVRIEEMLNYFDYAYAPPADGRPFAVHASVAAAPWAPERRLVRIGVKAREVAARRAPPANLIFLIDVSGSMDDARKLPLVRKSLELLVERLGPEDSVGIVTYAGTSGVALEPTTDKDDVRRAIARLRAGGSTNGSAGIETAYRLAQRRYRDDGINRVILASDGDFNVGLTSDEALIELARRKAKEGVFLTVLGFGMGDLNDAMMEQLADSGNGNYAYVDTLDEARKVLGRQLAGTLVTVAKDVKIQVEFNPERVASYRLIGYENRALAAEDFNDDAKDAGEIGSGHTVTALYEVVPREAPRRGGRPKVDPLRYGGAAPASEREPAAAATDGELLTVKVRYKAPNGDTSALITRHVADRPAALAEADADFRFAAAVAGFGMKLAGSRYAPRIGYDEILALARSGLGADEHGLRAEFLGLVRKAERLTGH